MLTKGSRWAVVVGIIGATLASVTFAADPSAPGISTSSPRVENCDDEATAAEYDLKAEEYEAGAERYRAWASAEGMFSSDIGGSEWEFLQQAQRLDLAARRSRAVAGELREPGNSESASPEACGVESTAANG